MPNRYEIYSRLSNLGKKLLEVISCGCCTIVWIIVIVGQKLKGLCTLTQNNNLESRITQKRRKYNELVQEVSKYEKILGEWCVPQEHVLRELSLKRSKLLLKSNRTMHSDEKCQENEELFKDMLDSLTELVEINLWNLLEGGINEESKNDIHYGAYGLLLSACEIKTNTSIAEIAKEKALKKIEQKYNYIDNQGIEENVDQCLSILHMMLTLLPPLLPMQPQWQDDEIQNTFRKTWDENKEGPLIYYRPVLVYGNQFHVAFKGLVGNSSVLLQDK